MLKQRIITALVLLIVLALALTVAKPWGFPVLALLLVGAVIGEWLLLLGFGRIVVTIAALGTMLVLWMAAGTHDAARIDLAAWIAAASIWFVLALGLIAARRFPTVTQFRFFHACAALVLPAACWLALVAAYRQGLVFMLSILAVVWAADVAAYFAGRAFGKRKLAPSISPGKTWAGAVGGLVAAVGLAAASLAVPQLDGSFFARLNQRQSFLVVLLVVALLVVLSVVGDLFESHLKRQRGVKDSGRTLPGHGGVFDRMDALLPVVPVALLISRVL